MEAPLQIVFVPETAGDGKALTVTVIDAVAVQPLASVKVTV